ncbi:hypothetical protein INR49_013615, partial [Caranx melampygus]
GGAAGWAEGIKRGRARLHRFTGRGPRDQEEVPVRPRTPMKSLVVALLAVCALVPSVRCATNTIDDTQWATIAPNFCNGSRQSPINIVSASATADANLTAFTFTNFDSTTGLTKIENTGKTIKVGLASGIGVSGGDLPEAYDSLQFHLHWGNGSSVPGSEHTVDGKRYPMEVGPV